MWNLFPRFKSSKQGAWDEWLGAVKKSLHTAIFLSKNTHTPEEEVRRLQLRDELLEHGPSTGSSSVGGITWQEQQRHHPTLNHTAAPPMLVDAVLREQPQQHRRTLSAARFIPQSLENERAAAAAEGRRNRSISNHTSLARQLSASEVSDRRQKHIRYTQSLVVDVDERRRLFENIYMAYDADNDNTLDPDECKTLFLDCLKRQRTEMPAIIHGILHKIQQAELSFWEADTSATDEVISRQIERVRLTINIARKHVLKVVDRLIMAMIGDGNDIAMCLFRRMDDTGNGFVSRSEFVKYFDAAQQQLFDVQGVVVSVLFTYLRGLKFLSWRRERIQNERNLIAQDRRSYMQRGHFLMQSDSGPVTDAQGNESAQVEKRCTTAVEGEERRKGDSLMKINGAATIKESRGPNLLSSTSGGDDDGRHHRAAMVGDAGAADHPGVNDPPLANIENATSFEKTDAVAASDGTPKVKILLPDFVPSDDDDGDDDEEDSNRSVGVTSVAGGGEGVAVATGDGADNSTHHTVERKRPPMDIKNGQRVVLSPLAAAPAVPLPAPSLPSVPSLEEVQKLRDELLLMRAANLHLQRKITTPDVPFALSDEGFGEEPLQPVGRVFIAPAVLPGTVHLRLDDDDE